MIKVIEIRVLNDYRIWMRFNDFTEKVINFRPFIGKGFTRKLLDSDNFRRVQIESGGGIAWYNGYDFCPNYLKDLPAEDTREGKIHAHQAQQQ